MRDRSLNSRAIPIEAHGSVVAKADRVSASNPSLTRREKKTLREFVKAGKALDKPLSELIALGVRVKAIFATKPRGVAVMFEGKPYSTFESFVQGRMPLTGRTMRRILAKMGETDQRFANKGKKPKSLPEKSQRVEGKPEAEKASEPAPKPTLNEWQQHRLPVGDYRLKYFRDAALVFLSRYQTAFQSATFTKVLRLVGSPKHANDLTAVATLLEAAAAHLKTLAEVVKPESLQEPKL